MFARYERLVAARFAIAWAELLFATQRPSSKNAAHQGMRRARSLARNRLAPER
ncbi:MAG TPA: hypothetical protein VGO31_01770 [Microbacteriaceae bacterium]|jgi:hypothetical protein|nr:hypothetical protein [Microbacteriaceae bacterium]